VIRGHTAGCREVTPDNQFAIVDSHGLNTHLSLFPAGASWALPEPPAASSRRYGWQAIRLPSQTIRRQLVYFRKRPGLCIVIHPGPIEVHDNPFHSAMLSTATHRPSRSLRLRRATFKLIRARIAPSIRVPRESLHTVPGLYAADDFPVV